MNLSMQFDAVSEDLPGHKWLERWNRSWPEYRQWFIQRGGDNGPSKEACEAALTEHMPELLPTWKSLCRLAGNDELAARFLSTWCPPSYLGGCSLAALSAQGETHLVRNYDLSPQLNEGLLLRSEWTGTAVMGMSEFLWGLSDGINQHGLSVALAYGGSRQTGEGFGITTILRYLLETCSTVQQCVKVLHRVPSHMAYNLMLADDSGDNASIEMKPGGGISVMIDSVATNHQLDATAPEKAAFTKTFERFEHLKAIVESGIEPAALADEFLKAPLFQYHYSESLGTLFTADYNLIAKSLNLRWLDGQWQQSLTDFKEQSRPVSFMAGAGSDNYSSATQWIAPTAQAAQPYHWLGQLESIEPYAADKTAFLSWMNEARAGRADWATFSNAFTHESY